MDLDVGSLTPRSQLSVLRLRVELASSVASLARQRARAERAEAEAEAERARAAALEERLSQLGGAGATPALPAAPPVLLALPDRPRTALSRSQALSQSQLILSPARSEATDRSLNTSGVSHSRRSRALPSATAQIMRLAAAEQVAILAAIATEAQEGAHDAAKDSAKGGGDAQLVLALEGPSPPRAVAPTPAPPAPPPPPPPQMTRSMVAADPPPPLARSIVSADPAPPLGRSMVAADLRHALFPPPTTSFSRHLPASTTVAKSGRGQSSFEGEWAEALSRIKSLSRPR